MTLTNEPRFLSKIASFTKIALDEIAELEQELSIIRKKEASAKYTTLEKNAKYASTLEKAAEALYDTDFLTDDVERVKFLKLAKENPTYLAETLIKVCHAADVSLLGTPARASIKMSSQFADDDPVAAKAFGYRSSSLIFDE